MRDRGGVKDFFEGRATNPKRKVETQREEREKNSYSNCLVRLPSMKKNLKRSGRHLTLMTSAIIFHPGFRQGGIGG